MLKHIVIHINTYNNTHSHIYTRIYTHIGDLKIPKLPVSIMTDQQTDVPVNVAGRYVEGVALLEQYALGAVVDPLALAGVGQTELHC